MDRLGEAGKTQSWTFAALQPQPDFSHSFRKSCAAKDCQ